MQPHCKVGGVLFRLHRNCRPNIPYDEVRHLNQSLCCPLRRVQLRVYALTEASKYVLVFFGILATSSLGTGLWLVSIPSAKGNASTRCSLFSSDVLSRANA